VPFLLRFILGCELKDSVKSMSNREKYEQLAQPVKPKETVSDYGYVDDDCSEAAATDSSTEPESHILNSELCDSVREAVQQLPEKERTVIHALYYQNKGMKEIARDLHCSCQFAYKTRRNAYARLHKILKDTVQA
jgi:RNA polymerase sigma factor (sigma-70 family)